MSGYREQVRLLTDGERLGIAAGAFLTMVLIYYFFVLERVLGTLDWELLFEVLFLVPVAWGVTVGFHDVLWANLEIEVNSSHLTLTRGFRQRKFQLSEIVEVELYPPERKRLGKRKSLLYVFSRAFASLRGDKYLKLSLAGGKQVYLSSSIPENLVDILGRESQRAFREETLALVHKG